MDSAQLNKILFVIQRDDGKYLIYSPLNRRIGLTNKSGANVIARFLDSESLNDRDMQYIRSLYESGLLTETPLKEPVTPENEGFMPHIVTLFPTSRCNLRCRYCYANAGWKDSEMNFATAKAAIDLVATNAGLLGLPQFTVGFHGGGEPTLAWELITQAVDYAKAIAEQKGLETEIYAATNGMFNTKQRDYILKNFSNLNISFDGPPDIQNYNRPTASGAPSYALALKNMKCLDDNGFEYGVRATVTATTVNRLPEIAEWFSKELKIKYLHIEPVWLCGRCLTTGEEVPEDDDFIKNFLEAQEITEKAGISLLYSGLRYDALLSKFCGAAGNGFNVLPDGIVTSCYEITEADNPKAELFHYGRYDAASGQFVFDKVKLARLQQYAVEKIPYCRDCFCKWHCAGDCISKVFDLSGDFTNQGSPRCKLNRKLTLIQLNKLLTKNDNDNDT
jgi:uncharacterized protein